MDYSGFSFYPWFSPNLDFHIKILSFLCCAIFFSHTRNPYTSLPSLVLRIDHLILMGESPPQTGAFIKIESQHSDLSPTKLILKKPLQQAMASKKQPTTGDDTTSKANPLPSLGHHLSKQP